MPKKIFDVNFMKIEKAMWEAGINSYLALSRVSKLDQAYLSRSKKRGQLGMDALFRISEAVKKPISYFIIENCTSIEHNQINNLESIPVLNCLSATFPQEIAGEEIIAHIHMPNMPVGAYAIQAKDENMAPFIKNGDYVLFLPTVKVKSGDIVIVNNEWGETSIKRYREKPKIISFDNDNPEYCTHNANEKYQIMGKIIEIWRNLKI